jgi:hypothetical protein
MMKLFYGSMIFSVDTEHFTLHWADLRNISCGTLPNKTAYKTNPANWLDENHVLNTSFILATATPLSGRHEGKHSLPGRDII